MSPETYNEERIWGKEVFNVFNYIVFGGVISACIIWEKNLKKNLEVGVCNLCWHWVVAIDSSGMERESRNVEVDGYIF